MANEETNQPTPIDPQNPPEPIKEIEDKSIRELRDVPVETIPDEELPELAQAIKADEPAGQCAKHAAPPRKRSISRLKPSRTRSTRWMSKITA